MSRPTIEDVAKLAGVSIKTVSRVVNNETGVRETTREKVSGAIAELGYSPNLSARRLAGKRSFLLALLYDNPSASYVTNVQEGALSVCRSSGYDLLIHPCDFRDEALEYDIIRLVKDKNIDGLILTPPLSDKQNLIDRLEEASIQFVLIAPASIRPGQISVRTTDKPAAEELTQSLIDKGHQLIGFVTGLADHKAVAHRYQGYLNALSKNGLSSKLDWVVQGDLSFESGVEAAAQLLAQPNPVTAIFASNDDMAAGVIFYAHQNKVRVPEDLSVVGFDDIPLAQRIWPALTTIKQPIFDMAEQATLLLLKQIRGEPIQQHQIVIPTKIVQRDSVGVKGE
ncbi:LacI family DNA-binding transcriptional regulator [Teredinibacter sp. KSP-S5-2]|uniref:LacI family DNA-binding transcriptional regulator n=1 Tax=Teredinibacter sp. KSP-S5-2 TaxID=3034506 RepID=UPI0029346E7C|nr:LacI family DNA-binding transcriptional regulator [Teredinibacter sp. KSP-S5-2]WNO10105.1 LacI family DNA-binding transcriptional regulator [Teredinibacter sp. KSP-S5-2]